MGNNKSQKPKFSNPEERNIEDLKNLFVDINQRRLIDKNLPPAPRAVFRKQHGIAIGKFIVLPPSESLKRFQDQDLGIFPCIQDLLHNKFPRLKTNINQIFGGNTNNINFIGIEYTDLDLDGKTYLSNKDNTNYTMGLDSTLMKNATKKYLIATI
ncbi:hypothetical protein [Sphingobacterium sp. MYb382]|uniref:hypothetical protein n=1 Tax=Sphingobacterium sp. MYb382 TaxID=2745278 RepID=UPI0030AAA375